MITGLLIISILSYIFSNQYFVFATEDSFSIIFHGRGLVESGLVPWSISQFTEWGVIVPVIQMAAGLFSFDYLSGYQTILAVCLIAILFLGMFHELKNYFPLITSLIIAGAFILVLATKQFLNHSFYIHNNLTASIFLLLAIYSYWKFIKSNEDDWMILGSISITAFSFSRIEGPIYAILIILLVVSIKLSSYKQTLTMVVPYALIAIAWHVALLLSGGQNQLLSSNNILIILIALISLLILAFFSSKLKPLLSVMPLLILTVLFFGVVLAILVEPEHMITSITNYWQNLVHMYSWGWTWFVLLFFVPLIFWQSEQLPENWFLIHTIGAYILVIILIALARTPYRLGETDSSNRLMIQILPIILFTIASNAATLKKWVSPDL